MLFKTEPDGTLKTAAGKVIVFSIARFVQDICLGGHCFICGVSPKVAAFNNEHIIPRWILEFTQQFNGAIGLPNQTDFRGYGGYTTPCCVQCNTGLSDAFETVLAPLMKVGYKALRQFLEENGSTVIFRWLALIYLKTHLRDAQLRISRDRREGNDRKIGDMYDWKALHHVHCIARSHYTGIEFDTRDIGTMLIVPALTGPEMPVFDYADVYLGRAIMIRVGDVACFAVLNDASIVYGSFPRAQEVLNGGPPLNPYQLRELYAELAWRNLCLKSRPSFATNPIPTPHFEVRPPSDVRFAPPTPGELGGEQASYGKLLLAVCSEYFAAIQSAEKRAEAESLALKEQLTFFTTELPRWSEGSFDTTPSGATGDAEAV